MRVVLLKMQAKSQGGLEKYASRIALAFAKKGADVACLTTQLPEKPVPGVEYHAFPICKWPGFLRLEQFDRCVNRWLNQNPIDVVFGMERNRIQTHIRAGNGVHAAYLQSRRSSEGLFKYGMCLVNPLHRKILELEKTAFEHPALKKIFVNSHMVRQDLLRFYTVDPSKIEVIHNGVEWGEHESSFAVWDTKKASISQNFGLDPKQFHLLFIGHGYRRKGLDQLLKALSLWQFRDFHLSVIGKDKHIDQYRAQIMRLGLQNRVSLFGPQKDLSPFYQLADVLVIPSFYDPFANVTLEALSFGLFVVSSKTNGGHEILNQQTGTLIDDLTKPESMIAALDRAVKFYKTVESARRIRNSISHLDFSHQLTKLINACA